MTPSLRTTSATVALGLACVLALTACIPGQDESPTNATASSVASDQRDASSIREDFYTEITQITDEAGGDWTYLDGDPFSPDDRDPFSPKPCGADDGPHQLLLMVISSPTDDGPAAIKHMKSVLEAHGMKITSYIPGKTKREASAINAELTSGQFVSYRANDLRTRIRFGSECSSHPTMLQDLNRSAPHREGSPRP
ncbi:MAG: hypothetical protein L0J68_03950 [Micrococcaceae bacterium]|nr:hypothetical protein [Micrococcaceae bacterium]